MKISSILCCVLAVLCILLYISNSDSSSTIYHLEKEIESLESEISSLEYEIEDAYSSGYDDGYEQGEDSGYYRGVEDGFSDGVRSNCEGNYEAGFEDGRNSWYGDAYLHETFYEYYAIGFRYGFCYSNNVYNIPRFNPDYDLSDILETTWNIILES